MRVHRFRHQPVLGTEVEILVNGVRRRRANDLDGAIVEEIERLEQALSAYRSDSELERWKRGEVTQPGEELSAVLSCALDWQQRSGGRFVTSSGALTAVWREAERSGIPPGIDALSNAVRVAGTPCFAMVEGVPTPTADCAAVNLNAFAKGWIADRAAAHAVGRWSHASVLVNAGGDLVHRGEHPMLVGIENPLRPHDNEPTLTRILLRNAAVATSGRSRRGFRVGQRWYSHVIDPRTGLPADHIASISVVADNAATADVVATVAGLMEPHDAVDYVDALGLAVLVVLPVGTRLQNPAWRTLERVEST